MADHPTRFRVNPVEVCVFSVVSLVFLSSIYDLFNDRQGFRTAAVAPSRSDRSPAAMSPIATAQTFANLEVGCDGDRKESIDVAKVKLTGSLCAGGASVLRTRIINTTNKFSATVFTDLTAGKFSTDYIPLVSGANSIQIELTLQGGRQSSRELVVSRR